ncbi:MAG: hypothetical protein GC162_00255 [Planctomycetes bacterium]|nr:hypothetical protein [Planctomycetota bacterium]
MRNRQQRKMTFAAALAACTLAAPLTRAATTYTWDHGASTGNWGTAANWSPDGVPTDGDSLQFDASVSNANFAQTNNLPAGTQIANITWTATGVGGFTISGNSFTLTGAISNNSTTATGNQVFNTAITLSNATHQITAVAGRTITFNGNITGAGSFFFRNQGTEIFNGNVNISGSFGKTDGGLTTVNTTGNTWSATNLARGTLKLGINNALATSAVLTLGQGSFAPNPATFDMAGFNQTVGGLTSLNGGDPANPGTRLIGNSSTTSDSTLTVTGGTTTFGDAGAKIVDAVSGGTKKVNLTLTGGALTLASDNTYTGKTTVSGGVLNVTGSIAANSSASVLVGADSDGDFSTGPDTKISRAVAAAGSYAGLGSAITSSKLTKADLKKGTNGTGSTQTLSMQWRTLASAAGETGANDLWSDVLNLTGIDGSTFVLQMSYSTFSTEAATAAADLLRIKYLDGSDVWVNAINGNHGSNTGGFFLGAYVDDASHNLLGAHGVDTTNHVVWAVLDHNSQFAVAIPTPAALPAGLALIGLLTMRHRK